MDARLRFRQYLVELPLAAWLLGLTSLAVVAGFVLTEDLATAWPWLLLTLLLCDAFLVIPLTLTVTATDIEASLAGVMRHRIPLADVVGVEVRRYRPLRQFGGWGWRYGKAGARQFAMAGNRAVVLTLADAREVYLGARDLDALAAAVDRARHGGLAIA